MSTTEWARPTILEGRLVRLEPMSLAHLDGLADVAFDAAIWRWTIARPTERAALEAWMRTAIAAADAGTEVPFVTIDRATGRPIGSYGLEELDSAPAYTSIRENRLRLFY